MNRFEAMKNMGWGPGNPCFGCGAFCCEHATIPVTAYEHERLFPDLPLHALSNSGDGFVIVDPCPHLENEQCQVERNERPEACKRYPASPVEVPDSCHFPKDIDTVHEWYQEQLQRVLETS